MNIKPLFPPMILAQPVKPVAIQLDYGTKEANSMMTRYEYVKTTGPMSTTETWRSGIWLVLLISLLGFGTVATAEASAPNIFFTDLESGPNSGGENGNGAYVTLYGNNFGTSQGSSTVTLNGSNCLRVVSWGTSHLWYQKIIVQLQPSCTTGNFSVTVNGQSSNTQMFTVRAGNIRYVATNGNDNNTGVFASPWRTVQKCHDSTVAGDICYVGPGIQETQTRAYETSLIITNGGTAARPKAIIGYPNASPQPRIGAGAGYAIRVPDIGNTTDYWVFANLNVYSSSGGPALQIIANHDWRVIGNHIECPNFNDVKGCVTVARNNYTYFYGNELTNVGVNPASQKQSHALYYTTQASHNWTAWNYIHDNYTCRAIQYHSSPIGGGGAGDCTGLNQVDIHIHDNNINGDNCDGINLATVDAASWPVEIYNNVISNTGLRRPTDGPGNFTCIVNRGWNNAPSCPGNPAPSGTINIFNNTLYNCGRSIPPENFSLYGAVGNESSSMNMVLRNNAVYMTQGPYIESQYNKNISGANNLWYGQGNGPSQTTGNINADPRFVSAGSNFQLSASSPAIDAGITINTLRMDVNGNNRPQGNGYDIGAVEYGSGTAPSPTPNPPNPATDLRLKQ